MAFPKRRLEIDNGDEPVPVYVVNSHDPRAGAFLRPSPLASLTRQRQEKATDKDHTEASIAEARLRVTVE